MKSKDKAFMSSHKPLETDILNIFINFILLNTANAIKFRFHSYPFPLYIKFLFPPFFFILLSFFLAANIIFPFIYIINLYSSETNLVDWLIQSQPH